MAGPAVEKTPEPKAGDKPKGKPGEKGHGQQDPEQFTPKPHGPQY